MRIPPWLKKRIYGYGALLLLILPVIGWGRVEAEWLAVRQLHLSDTPACRFVFITDLHHKGDAAYLRKVVKRINSLNPDFVCFTGDIVERREYLKEATGILGTFNAPLYGVPGNHDEWVNLKASDVEETFLRTGGKWLNSGTDTATWQDRVVIHGGFIGDMAPGKKNIVLTHYPADAASQDRKWDLVLAGHSHGGQLRLPFTGALILPPRTGDYDLGLFDTPAGPLYVNPGIGTWLYKLRFFCRPEITVIEL